MARKSQVSPCCEHDLLRTTTTTDVAATAAADAGDTMTNNATKPTVAVTSTTTAYTITTPAAATTTTTTFISAAAAARSEIHKDVACCSEQILEAAVRTLTSHLTDYRRWIRHAGHCWRSRDKLISDILLRTPTHGHTSFDRIAETYIRQLCLDSGFRLFDLPSAMVD